MMKNFRLLRVLCHFLLVNGIFFLTYKLRLLTAILPDILTPIPLINGEELRFFAFFSSILFVVIGGLKGFYPSITIKSWVKLGFIGLSELRFSLILGRGMSLFLGFRGLLF